MRTPALRSTSLPPKYTDAPPSPAARLIAPLLLLAWPKNAFPGGDVLLPYVIYALASLVLWVEFRLVPFRARRLRIGHRAVSRLLRWERRTAGWLCTVADEYPACAGASRPRA